MWELSLLQACLGEEDCVIIHVYLQDIIQMKRVGKSQGWSRLSQEWIKLINTQSAQDVPRGIKRSHGVVSIVDYALCTNPWSSWEFFVGLGCGVQVQVKHHEEIKCLKLAVHCGDNGLVKMCGRVAHSQWSMGEQSTSLHRFNAIKKGGPTWGSQDRRHLAQVDHVQGKGLLLIGFLFYRSHDCSWETGL